MDSRSNVLRVKSVFIVFIILLLLLGTGLMRETSARQMAKDFHLPDLSGKMVSFKDFKGKIVFVDFWATYCVPCRKTLPELVALDKKYRDRGLVILGISVDNPDSYDNKYVSDFKNMYHVTYQILRADVAMMKSYLGVEEAFLPTLIIIDRDGSIVETHVGYDKGYYEKALKKLLESE